MLLRLIGVPLNPSKEEILQTFNTPVGYSSRVKSKTTKLTGNSDARSDKSKISNQSVSQNSLNIKEEPEDTLSDEMSEES